MIDVLICGISGKMGAAVYELLRGDNRAKAVCGVDIRTPDNINIPVYAAFDGIKEKVDVIIDFSSPRVLKSELDWAAAHSVSVVLGTTGFNEEQLKLIDRQAKNTAIFAAANFSLGVNLLIKLVREAALILGDTFDIEIIEKHHRQKADAPSGTALMLARSANVNDKGYLYGRDISTGKRGNEIGVHAIRGGTIVGEHEIIFAGEDEIITFTHSAQSKKVFASGAIEAALFLAGKPAGNYGMQNIIAAAL